MDVPAGDIDDAHVGIEERLYALNTALMALPAADIRDVGIKLAALLGMAPIECGQTDEFPWPELRMVQQDLTRLMRIR
jgi:hypothetical protein